MSKSNGLPDAWKMSTIEDACSLVTDGTHNSPTVQDQGDFLYITSKNIRPFRLDLSTAGHVSRDVHAAIHRACPVEFGDVLFVKDGANTGNAAVNTVKEPFSLLSSVALLKPKKDTLDPSYLVHWLNCDEGYRCMTQNMSGSAIRRLVLNEIRSRRFPLPPLPEQRRIAAILDKADAIRRKREEGIRLTEELLRSTFLEMFGDPATNPKGWDVKPFGELARNEDGRRKPVKEADRAERHGDYPYYGASGIIDYVDDFLFNERTLLIAEDGANLLARATPIAFIADGKYWVNNHAHVVSDNGKADLDFLRFSLNLRKLDDFVTGSAQPKLNQASLNRIPIPLPPLSAQRKFAEIVRKLNVLREHRQVTTNETVNLFNSLVQRAFRGELTIGEGN